MLEFAVVDGGLLLGLLAASAVSAAGSIYANRQNLKQQKSVNSQAIELADTAHQREVADLYAAGLNPVLSATGNGASVPSLGVANQDNVLSSFGANARSIGESLSRQRALSNESLALDNEGSALANQSQELSNKMADWELFLREPEINTSRYLSELRQKASYDYLFGKEGWKIDDEGNLLHTPDFSRSAYKDMFDSVKAEVKNAGTQYLQGWSNNVRGWANTGIDAFNAASSFRRGGAMIRHAESEDFRRTNEDIRRQERHDYFKRKWR